VWLQSIRQKAQTYFQQLMGGITCLLKSVPDFSMGRGIQQAGLTPKIWAHVPNLSTQVLSILMFKSSVKFRLIMKIVHYGTVPSV